MSDVSHTRTSEAKLGGQYLGYKDDGLSNTNRDSKSTSYQSRQNMVRATIQ